MDPNALWTNALWTTIAKAIENWAAGKLSADDRAAAIEHCYALNRWIQEGGFKPAAWGTGSVAPRHHEEVMRAFVNLWWEEECRDMAERNDTERKARAAGDEHAAQSCVDAAGDASA